jgi:hypothetical protein
MQRKKKLQEKAESNLQKLEKEKEKFNLQIPVCIKNIQTQIESNLRGASSMLQSMILNNTDIQDKINQIVRMRLSQVSKESLNLSYKNI